MPRKWPPLTASEIGECLSALGWIHDHDEGSHQMWVDEATRRVVSVDVKWNPVSGPMLKHVVTEQMKVSRERFYHATKATRRKI